MTGLTYFLTALFAYGIGFAVSMILNVIKKPDGLLGIDTRDPEKDFYDFVFLIPTGDVEKKRYLKIEVQRKT